MAQLIAGNTVTEVTKTSAKVGCTKVTREDLETLLKSMDSARPEFEIVDGEKTYKDSNWFHFTMRGEQSGGGWFRASESLEGSLSGGWTNRSVEIMVENKVAAQLLQYLAKRLGYEVQKIYIPSGK